MGVSLPEALYLLRALDIESVKVEALIATFLPPTPQEPQQDLPELPEPPQPPKNELVFATYEDAKKAAKKGQKPVKNEVGEWVLM